MSDNEFYSGNSDSDSDSSDVELKINKPPAGFKEASNIDTYEDESDIEEDVEIDPEIDVDEDIQKGGDEDSDIEDVDIDDEDEDEEELAEDDEDNIDEEDQEGGSTKAAKNKAAKPKKTVLLQIDSDDDYDDDDDVDENYLQKFDSEITKNYINEFHPECFVHNYEEISDLTKVVRDSYNIIIDPLHRTIPFLTKYEKARILGQRAKQIEAGAKPLVKVPENVIDGYIIAEIELQQKRIPFIIRRPLSNGGSEYWKLTDLEMIGF